jgi:uncharacterized protein (TIGR02145 family)
MKKVSLILSAVVMTAMMLNACGGGTSTEKGVSTEEGVSTEDDLSSNEEIVPNNINLSKEEKTINEKVLFDEVTIGKQVWMTKNLNVDKFRNGDPIPHAKTKEEWYNAGKNKQPAWCYYDNDPTNDAKYGKMYNWYAVNDPRGLAPVGYHIPSDEQWTVLTDYLGGYDKGKKMKSSSGWAEDGNGTNESGFSALPGGYRFGNGNFGKVGIDGAWWSSTENTKNSASSLYMSCRSDDARVKNSKDKQEGYSVRCLRD